VRDATQLLLCLDYLHSKKILHRDLKTKNIFMTKKLQVKLGDFGLSKMMGSQTDFAQSAVGTPYYLSPELCEGKPYNHKSDVWAIGCEPTTRAACRRAGRKGVAVGTRFLPRQL
jgi:NIMA (never in mitosis gene a)-related kinase